MNSIFKAEAPQLLKHFFVEIRQTGKEKKVKEYEPGSLRGSAAPDSFDIENFNEVVSTLFVKRKDLKKKSPGNKPNQSEPLEDHQIEQ